MLYLHFNSHILVISQRLIGVMLTSLQLQTPYAVKQERVISRIDTSPTSTNWRTILRIIQSLCHLQLLPEVRILLCYRQSNLAVAVADSTFLEEGHNIQVGLVALVVLRTDCHSIRSEGGHTGLGLRSNRQVQLRLEVRRVKETRMAQEDRMAQENRMGRERRCMHETVRREEIELDSLEEGRPDATLATTDSTML
jgi:hypothetical protein